MQDDHKGVPVSLRDFTDAIVDREAIIAVRSLLRAIIHRDDSGITTIETCNSADRVHPRSLSYHYALEGQLAKELEAVDAPRVRELLSWLTERRKAAESETSAGGIETLF